MNLHNNQQNFILKRLLLAVFLFCSAVAFAQGGTIRGKVLDKEFGDALVGALVGVEGSTYQAAANLDGDFIFANIPAGKYTLTASYVAYQPLRQTDVSVRKGDTTTIELYMTAKSITLGGVEVVAYVNMESEAALLEEQRESLVATQSVGARELSRKGIGDAQAAVAQVSGVSRQEGVKNVFVRGLGDRYNATLLNGFPIPSEDPEYKNIALDFFGTDVIKNIGVSKVFSASDYSDVGGAVINISSKELVGKYAFGLDVSGGVNTAVFGQDFLRQDGSDYFGFANKTQPTGNKFNFSNKLDPSVLSAPINHSYGISGGKIWKLGEKQNPLSFFIVASHSTDYAYTDEVIRYISPIGQIRQDQKGKTYSQNINQLVLANLLYSINQKHHLQYNFMLIHANEQYVGDYQGYRDEINQLENGQVFSRRQQSNDNLLLVNQLLSDWELSKRWKLNVSASYNTVNGNEPDRRENYLSMRDDGQYFFTGSNRQRRFFSELTDSDINAKAGLTFKLNDRFKSDNSELKFGYTGRFTANSFKAVEYGMSMHTAIIADLDNLKLDDVFNSQNMEDDKFHITTGSPNTYSVTKNVHSGYAEASYQVLKNLSGNVGFRMDAVDMSVAYKVKHIPSGETEVNKMYFLPSLNLKYDLTQKNSLRLGASKTYTLPQSKEIAPFLYDNISFASEGNPNLKPSENYNVDLKWDFYISSGELFTVNGFFKYIKHPIGRVDKAGSNKALSYDNISDKAIVGGVEVELRKNIFNRFNTGREETNKLSFGINASYIYSNLKLDIDNTTPRNTALEGASPFLANADISYTYTKRDKSLTASLVFNYFSRRIHTLGADAFKNSDIMEEGVPTLDFAASYRFNKHFSIKIKAANLLNQSYRLTREVAAGDMVGEKITLNEYKKGQNISIGFSYEL